jgi:hypothetical protein
MAEQMAVDYLLKELSSLLGPLRTDGMTDMLIVDAVERAREIEKQRLKETFKQSRQAKIFEEHMPPVWESFEEYYSKTYMKTDKHDSV